MGKKKKKEQVFCKLYAEDGKIGRVVDLQIILQKSITTDLGKSFTYEKDKDSISFHHCLTCFILCLITLSPFM